MGKKLEKKVFLVRISFVYERLVATCEMKEIQGKFRFTNLKKNMLLKQEIALAFFNFHFNEFNFILYTKISSMKKKLDFSHKKMKFLSQKY